MLSETIEGKRQHFRMANSASDHDRFVSYLRTLPAPCIIGFEATSNYHRALGHRLVAEGFETCFISSIASARYREVMFNSWDKNDPKDAAVLLELLKQGITQRYVDPLAAGHHDLQGAIQNLLPSDLEPHAPAALPPHPLPAFVLSGDGQMVEQYPLSLVDQLSSALPYS